MLDNPKAWLGTVYHEVLEKLWMLTEEDFTDEELGAIDGALQASVAPDVMANSSL